MNTNLENFRPRLRAGRVIPQGARIIFETSEPYNQIILPMALADMILLCSGQFSVREIIEKMYQKQRSVPFKPMLTALHLLHQNGFFENGDELELSPELKSWMEPRRGQALLSLSLSRIVSVRSREPHLFYGLTLVTLILSIFGLAHVPESLFSSLDTWITELTPGMALLVVFTTGSVLQTLRYAVRILQLLLLTSKAYNVSLRLSAWGLHLHVGDEANDLFENRLYASMFYVSQVLVAWLFVFLGDALLPTLWQRATILVASALTFYELNPFVNGGGRKLIQTLLLPQDRDVIGGHFSAESLANAHNPRSRKVDQDFARICAITGAVWLSFTLMMLYGSAITFGPMLITRAMREPSGWVWAAAAIGLWLSAVYYVAQAFVETILANLIRPHWRAGLTWLLRAIRSPRRRWSEPEVIQLIEALPLFSHFHDQHLSKIIAESRVLEFSSGGAIIQEGSPADELFVLFAGEVQILRVSGQITQHLGELGPGSVFGESSLVDNSPRAAQVVAKTAATVLRVPVEALRRAATEAQSVRQLEVFRNAILVNQFFASSPVFRSLSASSIEFLCSRGSLEYVEENQVVFRQGDRGDSLYLILRGSVRVSVHGQSFKRLDQGSFFGEIAMIANIPRTATIQSVGPGVFFRIGAEAFWEVLVQHMDLGVFIESISESRLKEDLQISTVRATGAS